MINHIEQTLLSCHELNGFCTHNGWIDSGTLHYRILYRDDRQVLALVQFEEIVVEGSGCIAARAHCGGRVRLHLDRFGEVQRIELV